MALLMTGPCKLQMPKGVPVATVAIGNAANAGLLAVRMLAASDAQLQVGLPALRLTPAPCGQVCLARL